MFVLIIQRELMKILTLACLCLLNCSFSQDDCVDCKGKIDKIEEIKVDSILKVVKKVTPKKQNNLLEEMPKDLRHLYEKVSKQSGFTIDLKFS